MFTVAAGEAPAAAAAVTQEEDLLFCSTQGTILYKVVKGKQRLGDKGSFRIDAASGGSVTATMGVTSWTLTSQSHTLRSLSKDQEPTYTFSNVDQDEPDTFYCVIFKPGTAASELSLLDQILSICTSFHVSDRPRGAPAAGGLALPQIQLPNMDPAMVKELMRKGAEDTGMVFCMAGGAAQQLLQHAARMHKQFAPAPAATPVVVDPLVKEKMPAQAGVVVDGAPAEYRRNVGLCLVNPRGLVFAAKRLDDSKNTWQMPQGGIDPGETAQQAALRELQEETSVTSATLLQELDRWLAYDFPTHVREAQTGDWCRFKGQAQRWFLLEFTGDDSEINIDTEHKEFSQWRWMRLEELPGLVVPFKREVYQQVAEAFCPTIAQRMSSR